MLNILGISITILGIWIVWAFSPLNSSITDGGDSTDSVDKSKNKSKVKNRYMTIGVAVITVGSSLQIASNLACCR